MRAKIITHLTKDGGSASGPEVELDVRDVNGAMRVASTMVKEMDWQNVHKVAVFISLVPEKDSTG